MSYQTISNPYTGQIKVIDLSQPGAHSQLYSLYQQGWTSATAQQTQYAQQTAPQMYQPQPVQPPKPVALATVSPVKTTTAQTIKTTESTAGKVYVPEGYAKDLPNLGPGAKKNIVETKGISFDEYHKRLQSGQDVSNYHIIASAQDYAALGPGVKSKVQVDVQLKWYEHLTSVKEEEGEQVTAKSFALQVGDAVVPFMYTARNWNEMADWEKGVHLFADTVFSVGYLKSGKALATTLKGKVTAPATKPITSVTERTASGQVRVMTPTKQAQAEYQTIQKLAKDAGETMGDFQLKRAAVTQAEQLGVIPKNIALPGNRIQRTLLNGLQTSAQRAEVAGRAFAETFPNVAKLTPAQLKKVEQLSGFKGLAKSVRQIGTHHAELEKQWAMYDKLLARRGISDWFTRLKLKDVELTQKQLQKAYSQYSRIIKPQRSRGIDVRELKPQTEITSYEVKYKIPTESKRDVPGFEPHKADWGKGVKTGKGTKTKVAVAVKERTKPLWEAELKAVEGESQAAKELRLEREAAGAATRAPKVESKPKFGLPPKSKTDPHIAAKAGIPSEVFGRMTYDQIAKEYGEQAIVEAIGVPLRNISTANQMKTATQINQEFQEKLAGATQAATSALVNTYQSTQNWNQSYTDAMNAADTYLQLQPQAQTQTQAQTQLVIKTAVQQAVKELLETRPRPIPKKLPVGTDEEPKLEIERVEGIPRKPGIIRWNKGVVQVEIVPPYREGSEDIRFTGLKQPQRGKGSQERTLTVVKGQAPKLVVLGRQGGIAKTHIIRGKKMKHIRQIVRQRGPGVIDSRGNLHKQRRGSVI